jgi:hypothetical protein
MYLLRFHDREELSDMRISDHIETLKAFARNDIDGELQFKGFFDIVSVNCKGQEIGIIGEVTEI